MPMSGLCQARRLTAFRRPNILATNSQGDTKLVLEKITEAGKQIPGFANLPVTAQISMLYDEIEAARKLSIPLSAIQSALNQAGSTVTLRYMREALSVVRARMRKNGAAAAPETQPSAPTPKAPAKPGQSGVIEKPAKTPREAREQKAEQYTGSATNNPLLRQLQSKD
ncbi:hypothetical protein ACM7ZU_29905 [Pseudomonas aeruginosa]